MNSQRRLFFATSLVLISILTISCGSQDSAIFVWIDVPEDGLSFPDLRTVTIEGHATGPDGVRMVELYVDGDLIETLDDLPAEGVLSSFQTEWTPEADGNYTIHAIAYGPGGSASQYDQTRISFGEEEMAAEVVEEPPQEEAPIGNESLIQFWAEPEKIQAGGCTDIKWHVENVQNVVFGGVEQAFDGTYHECLCNNQTYSLMVTHLDGTEEKRQVGISVTGTCEATESEEETTTKDTTPPPAPVLKEPGNKASLGCRSNQNLSWNPVSDESGISQYQVSVQRHSGDKKWKDIPGSVFSGISGKKKSVSVIVI